MARFLSAEWMASAADPLAPAARTAVRVQYFVTGGPDGEVKAGSVVADGGSVETTLGDLPDPDVTLTIAAEDALAVITGAVTPNVAYMRGRLKAAGHTGLLFALLAAAEGDRYETARAALADHTDP